MRSWERVLPGWMFTDDCKFLLHQPPLRTARRGLCRCGLAQSADLRARARGCVRGFSGRNLCIDAYRCSRLRRDGPRSWGFGRRVGGCGFCSGCSGISWGWCCGGGGCCGGRRRGSMCCCCGHQISIARVAMTIAGTAVRACGVAPYRTCKGCTRHRRPRKIRTGQIGPGEVS